MTLETCQFIYTAGPVTITLTLERGSYWTSQYSMSCTTVTLRVTTMLLEDKLPETRVRYQASRLGLLRRETHQSHDALPGDTLLSRPARILYTPSATTSLRWPEIDLFKLRLMTARQYALYTTDLQTRLPFLLFEVRSPLSLTIKQPL